MDNFLFSWQQDLEKNYYPNNEIKKDKQMSKVKAKHVSENDDSNSDDSDVVSDSDSPDSRDKKSKRILAPDTDDSDMDADAGDSGDDKVVDRSTPKRMAKSANWDKKKVRALVEQLSAELNLPKVKKAPSAYNEFVKKNFDKYYKDYKEKAGGDHNKAFAATNAKISKKWKLTKAIK
jgi:hypothetical protein